MKRKVILVVLIIIILIFLLSGLTIFKINNNMQLGTQKFSENEDNTQATFEVLSQEDLIMNVIIIFTNNEGINQIRYPNGNILVVNNKKEIALDYKIQMGNTYQFVVKSSRNTQTMILDSDDLNKILIANEEGLCDYPTLTYYGINFKKYIQIEYANNATNNFYSLDEGKTWIEYTGKIEVKQNNTKIKAKSIINNKINPIINKKIDILENDAIGVQAYDGNIDTFMAMTHANGPNTRYMKIDKSIWNKNIRIKWYNWSWSDNYYSSITFLDSSGELIDSTQYILPQGQTYDTTYVIPENAVWLKYYVQFADDDHWVKDNPKGYGALYEIQPVE